MARAVARLPIFASIFLLLLIGRTLHAGTGNFESSHPVDVKPKNGTFARIRKKSKKLNGLLNII